MGVHLGRRYAGLEQVGFSGVNCNGVEQVIAADMLPMRVRVDHDNGPGGDPFGHRLDVPHTQSAIDEQGPVSTFHQITVGVACLGDEVNAGCQGLHLKDIFVIYHIILSSKLRGGDPAGQGGCA